MKDRRLNFFSILLSLQLGSCLFDSYEKDLENDLRIVDAIVNANPVLESARDTGYEFFSYSAETGRINGWLNLDKLGLTDSNFYFPVVIRDFKRINNVSLYNNLFTQLPRGTRYKNWNTVVLRYNSICDPSPETADYLDEVMQGFPGGDWRDTQVCSFSLNLKGVAEAF